MNRGLVIALACIAAAAGGCAVTAAPTGPAPSINGSASPATGGPTPGNVYGAETNHYFGTGGP